MSLISPAINTDAARLLTRYQQVRSTTERLCTPLQVEDYGLQATADVSPVRWHLAHVSWFFETFVLTPHLADYHAFDPRYRMLFNSYYNTVGPQWSRPERGHLSRPTVAEIYAYRAHVDAGMTRLLDSASPDTLASVVDLVVLGLNHEQQHQELILTDVKFNLGVNPLRPAYREAALPRAAAAPALEWLECEGGLHAIGDSGEHFAFDNERPRHEVFLVPYRLANRPVTCGEYLEFVEAGGYREWRWWLSEGWRAVSERGWRAPLYWERADDGWSVYTLGGMQALDPHAPVVHVSHLEADAYARWRGARLPTEAEWEHAAATAEIDGNLLDDGVFHPLAGAGGTGLLQLFGDVWEWTQSAYAAYPGYRPQAGAIGEYNAKFMVGQLVLRGGSCATPRSHIRATYRNFFPPDARWQFSGIRLAQDV